MLSRRELLTRTGLGALGLVIVPKMLEGLAVRPARIPSIPLQLPGRPMSTRATGPFDVTLKPLDPYNKSPDAGLGRMSIDKQFHGDLEATSQGEMLTAMGGVKGSAGYVAVERVTGTLCGKGGSFVLQHNATMAQGAHTLNIIVVPDSGTGDLAGLTGRMNVIIADGKHSYEFEFEAAKES
ncbi:MAG: DUF3224 domain-containing protein [Gemmatimonadales bacterium]